MVNEQIYENVIIYYIHLYVYIFLSLLEDKEILLVLYNIILWLFALNSIHFMSHI